MAEAQIPRLMDLDVKPSTQLCEKLSERDVFVFDSFREALSGNIDSLTDDMRVLILSRSDMPNFHRKPKGKTNIVIWRDMHNHAHKVYLPLFLNLCPLAKLAHQYHSLLDSNHEISLKYPEFDTPIESDMAHSYYFSREIFEDCIKLFINGIFMPQIKQHSLPQLMNAFAYCQFQYFPRNLITAFLSNHISPSLWAKSFYAYFLHFHSDKFIVDKLVKYMLYHFQARYSVVRSYTPDALDTKKSTHTRSQLITYITFCAKRTQKRLENTQRQN